MDSVVNPSEFRWSRLVESLPSDGSWALPLDCWYLERNCRVVARAWRAHGSAWMSQINTEEAPQGPYPTFAVAAADVRSRLPR